MKQTQLIIGPGYVHSPRCFLFYRNFMSPFHFWAYRISLSTRTCKFYMLISSTQNANPRWSLIEFDRKTNLDHGMFGFKDVVTLFPLKPIYACQGFVFAFPTSPIISIC